MRLLLRDAVYNGQGVLTHDVRYDEAKLIPFMEEMEIPVSVAYPIVKKAMEESGLEPGERCLFNFVTTDQSILQLMGDLLEAAYPDNICVVDNDGDYDSDINCYVYELQYGKEFLSKVIDLIEKPEEAVLHLEDTDELLKTLAHWRVNH